MDRLEMTRRIAEEGDAYLRAVTAPTFNEVESPGLGIGVLRRTWFPRLRVEVDELAELRDGRVLARVTCHAGAPDDHSWPGVMIVGFRGDRVVSLWGLHDSSDWQDVVLGERDRSTPAPWGPR